jgi:predicted RNA-binding Zn ribbon-like protein
LNGPYKTDGDFRDGMPFLGGAAWIDLLNSTLSPDGGVTIVDFLQDNASFARWIAHAGLAPAGNVSAERRSAVEMRATLRPAFDLLASGEPLSDALIGEVNACLAKAPVVYELLRESKASPYRLRERPAHGLPGVAASLARDFASFLTSYEPERLKHCDNPACTMVFFDRGKNNRRRWCSSDVCGNRDKVANYRARKAARDNG